MYYSICGDFLQAKKLCVAFTELSQILIADISNFLVCYLNHNNAANTIANRATNPTIVPTHSKAVFPKLFELIVTTFCIKPSRKIKKCAGRSQRTKNANSNCRQTIPTYSTDLSLHQHSRICIFTKFKS